MPDIWNSFSQPHYNIEIKQLPAIKNNFITFGSFNQFAKINLEVNDIDTDLPIEEQLRNVENATDVVWSYLRNKLDREIEEILNDKDV